MKNCSTTLFYIICTTAAERSFTPNISCSMALCSSRKLPIKVQYGRGYSLKIHFLDSIWFPGMCYLIDFVDTAPTVRNFIRRSKLISSFKKKIYIKKKLFCFFDLGKLIHFKNKISLLIDELLWYLSKWQFAYFRLLAWCETVQN